MSLRTRVAASPFARAAAFPARAALVARHDARVVAASARWLLASREHTNFTYDLEPRNVSHLAWWVSVIGGVSFAEARGYVDEIVHDDDLRRHLERGAAAAERRGLIDRKVGYGRRIGWYALVRALRPSHVVETGTDKGLGTCVLASAVLRNGEGRVTTIDVSPVAGPLITGPYAEVVDRRFGDSIAELRGLAAVDLFLHDSLHTHEHETSELAAVPLTSEGLALSDNAHATDALAEWAERSGRQFLYFQERPRGHWYPGGGIGAAWPL